jgi:cellulose synthase/poly-beta-1,6-N-acetylglucosamine synthase-like glycosyltransferase
MLDLRVVALLGAVVVVAGAVAGRFLRLPVPTFEPGISRSPFAAPERLRRRLTSQQAHVGVAAASAPAPAMPRPEPRTTVLDVPTAVRAQRLDFAVNALRDRDPGLSASTTLTKHQRRGLIVAGVLLVLGLIVNFTWTLIALTGASTIAYVTSLAFRIKLFRLSLAPGQEHQITEADARAIPDSELPTYTVLVPAFHEPEVVAKLIESVGKMDYPADKLQILLLLEEDDTETVAAALASPGGERFEIVLVPQASPRTKPKALNYGLQFARGEMVTIYDVEDRPEPLQLRRAVVAFAGAPEGTACLQAQLSYFNPAQNMITRWFAIEYLMWFTQLLPGLSHLEAPIPLGGTSNHFKREVLEEMGGWDPFNVTEDADLGVRLHRMGYRTGVLQSETLEEANSDFVNWVKQRSRWYKGYVQTWIVHMRHPRQLWRDLGWRSFWRFNFFVGGTPFIALINPIFWAMTLAWFIGHPSIIRDIYPAPIFYTAVLCWLIGNFICVYVLLLCAVQTRRADLFLAALLSPFYWVMMAVAASKAFVQLVFQPSYWEKTTHGLDLALERRRRIRLVTPAGTAGN